MNLLEKRADFVASRADAWIETFKDAINSHASNVASRADAWIETDTPARRENRYRRVPRGRVD